MRAITKFERAALHFAKDAPPGCRVPLLAHLLRVQAGMPPMESALLILRDMALVRHLTGKKKDAPHGEAALGVTAGN